MNVNDSGGLQNFHLDPHIPATKGSAESLPSVQLAQEKYMSTKVERSGINPRQDEPIGPAEKEVMKVFHINGVPNAGLVHELKGTPQEFKFTPPDKMLIYEAQQLVVQESIRKALGG